MTARGAEVPIDYDHSFQRHGVSKAAGWLSSLRRQGNALVATAKWTGEAADAIRSGAYRFFSPEFANNFKDESGRSKGFTVLSGALTNRPFLKGMTPVALSEAAPSLTDADPDSRELLHDTIKAAGGDYLQSVDAVVNRAAFDRQMAGDRVDSERLDLHHETEQLAGQRGISYLQALGEIGADR